MFYDSLKYIPTYLFCYFTNMALNVLGSFDIKGVSLAIANLTIYYINFQDCMEILHYKSCTLEHISKNFHEMNSCIENLNVLQLFQRTKNSIMQGPLV